MTNLQKLVAKCIRYAHTARQGLAGWLLTLLTALFMTTVSTAQNIVPLSDTATAINLQGSGMAWVNASGDASPQQVTAGLYQSRFQPAAKNAGYALESPSALWLHYRFVRANGSVDGWLLEFPQPLLDQITVYQRSASGQWVGQAAGDRIANSSWPIPGRYAQFKLELPSPAENDVYVRIQHMSSISVLVQARTRASHDHRQQMEYLALGIAFGALLLLSLGSAAQSWMYRDPVYGWYALYAVLIALVVAAWTGVGGHLLWPDSGYWSDLAPGCLGILAAGAGLSVVHRLYGRSSGKSWFDDGIDAIGLAAVPLAMIYAALPRPKGTLLIGVYVLVIVLLAIHRAWITWHRKDPLGLWVLMAFTPMIFAAVLLMASSRGWVPSSWLSQHILLACFVLEVPLLLVALKRRSRQRHGFEARAQDIGSQDALTGLLTKPLFNDRLMQVIARAKRHKEPAAVVYIDLVNYGYIKQTWGTAVAEQSLLRSVIKLRRILRDVDTVGRIDEARFALVLEGSPSRESVTEMGARMIAAGLMPLKGLKPDVLLQFHVVGVLLHERLDTADEIGEKLSELMGSMGTRTRRPIRFLEPELTMPMDLGAQSDFEPESTNPKRHRLR